MTDLLQLIGLILFSIFLVIIILVGTVVYKTISLATRISAKRKERAYRSQQEFDDKWRRYNK